MRKFIQWSILKVFTGFVYRTLVPFEISFPLLMYGLFVGQIQSSDFERLSVLHLHGKRHNFETQFVSKHNSHLQDLFPITGRRSIYYNFKGSIKKYIYEFLSRAARPIGHYVGGPVRSYVPLLIFLLFLEASSHLYKRVCSYVRPHVCHSLFFSPL